MKMPVTLQRPPLPHFFKLAFSSSIKAPITLWRHVIDSNADRAALYACPEWRSIAHMLKLPKQPKKEDYSSNSDKKCSH